MDQTKLTEMAWNYFALHAGQRISIFNFFLVLSGSLAAGAAATAQKPEYVAVTATLSLLSLFTSFIFWKLDQRTSILIKNAEKLISEQMKHENMDHFDLFHQDETVFQSERIKGTAFTRPWSYTESFRFVFIGNALLSFCGLVYSFHKLFAGH